MNRVIDLFKQLRPLAPIPTGQKYQTCLSKEELNTIKAVIFDVYGTMLVSSSGDIGNFNNPGEIALNALHSAGIQFNGHADDSELGRLINREYIGAIQDYHARVKENGVQYPEVVIENIWRRVLETLSNKGLVKNYHTVDFKELAVIFEFASNPTFPMPGLKNVLVELSRKGYRLGLISNAQFFTPMLLKFFLGAPDFLDEKDIPYFENQYIAFSFKEGRAKPDPKVFENVRKTLEEERLQNSQVLYIGNDMYNDIWPAHRIGFKTVLFAGDERSLRLRKDKPEVKDLKPDVVITDLRQLLALFNISPLA
jgi:putative hydrolase of the HAD superfamily